MTTKETLERVLQVLPEERLHEVLDFARFVLGREEQEQWQRFGRPQFAKAYGPAEPEYTAADLKPVGNP